MLADIFLVFIFCLASCGGNSKSSANVPTEFCNELVKLAEGGNAEAQYRLGLYYGENAQSAQEAEKCVSLLQNSANQDFAPAKIVLSRMYTKGMGVPQDDQMPNGCKYGKMPQVWHANLYGVWAYTFPKGC